MVVNTVQTFDSSINRLIDADTSLFFTTEDGQLGVSDRTQAGTSILNSDGDGDEYLGLNGNVFFDGFTIENGTEPFINNGTADGSLLLRDINPNNNNRLDTPLSFSRVGDLAYFTAINEENGVALYSSDGTPSNTNLVADINSRTDTRNDFREFIDFNDTLYFVGEDEENGIELWTSDGQETSTQSITSFDRDLGISDLTATEENLYFTRNTFGQELWTSDGTTDGTELIATEISPEELTSVGNTLYFTANDGQIGRELWISNGTQEGTQILEDILPPDRDGNRSSNPKNLTDVGGRLFFTADDGQNGRELWVSDGAPENTRRVADLTEGEDSTRFRDNFTEVNGILYFTKDGDGGDKLWRSDGTQAGTFELEPEDLNLGGSTTPEFRNPERLIEFDNQLYFTGESYDSNTGGYVDALLTPEDSNTVSRLSNPDIGVHFYTTSASERDEYVDLGYQPEGSSFTAVDPTAEDAVGVYRFFNETTRVNIYTTNEMEIENLEQNSQFTSEGVVFGAYQTQVEGSIPIYRLRNNATNTHLFTPSVGERDSVLETLPSYESEGIAYYALPLEDA